MPPNPPTVTKSIVPTNPASRVITPTPPKDRMTFYEQPKKSSSNIRCESIDILRGLAMFFMVFVDVIGGAYPNIGHAPWDGMHLADFVMPFFLFVVGVSIALSYKSYYDLGVAAFVELLAELESKYNRRFEEIVKNEAEANRHREESDSTNRNPKRPLPIEEGTNDPQQQQQHAENFENPASNPTAQKTLLPDGMKQATETESAENDESTLISSIIVPMYN